MKLILILVLAHFSTAQVAQSWNALLKTSIFPDNANAFRPTASDNDNVDVKLEELSNLLSKSGVFNEIYGNYVNQFNKEAIRCKDVARHQVFRAKLLEVAQHNIEAQAGKYSWEKGVNQFTDMSEEEILAEYTGYEVELSAALANSNLPLSPPKHLPSQFLLEAQESKNWHDFGVVTPVKNQGQCGSCVPFAATGCLESSHALWHGREILDLSEQELVDCSRGNGNFGCRGVTGLGATFDYLKNYGLTTESAYPYEARDGACRSGGKSKRARATGWWRVQPHGDENALKEAVSSYGPITVTLHVNGAFQAYRGGVFDAPCVGPRNHAVLVVGYGNEGGKDYWLVKNSWSSRWGESGYIKVRRNYGNQCDIAADAVLINA